MPTTARRNFSNYKIEPAYAPDEARTLAVRLGASLTLAAGAILGEVTATPGVFVAYDDTAVNGAAVAKMILQRAVMTDAAGLVTYAEDSSAGGEVGEKRLTAAAYYRGVFRTADLPQAGAGALDAAAITDLGRLVTGSLADGVLQIGG